MGLISMARRLPTPGAGALWGTVIGAVLLADASLVAQKRETMSEWYSRHALPLAAITGYLLLHLHGRPVCLARFDPLHRAANAIRTRR